MNCPTDGTILVLAERTGIEIDHCPVCRGVWLDRGELDKLIDRAAGQWCRSPSPVRRRDGLDLDEDDLVAAANIAHPEVVDDVVDEIIEIVQAKGDGPRSSPTAPSHREDKLPWPSGIETRRSPDAAKVLGLS